MHKREYKYNIDETHHTKKIDSPSGTAKTLAEDMQNILSEKPTIKSNRVDNTTGIHKITYSSKEDEIIIKHIANNRDSFAIGALLAAEWIIGKKGVFNMNDVLTEY